MTDPGRQPGDPAVGQGMDEGAVRADERAKVERELASMNGPDTRNRDDGMGNTDEVVATPVDEDAIRADERARLERDVATDGRTDRDRVDDDANRADARAEAEHEFATRQDQATRQRADVGDVVVPTGRGSDTDDDDRLEPIEVVRTRSFSFGQLVTMLVGAAFIVLGVFALLETGVETPLDQPVEDVLGYAHTPLLGIIEVGVGALLVLLSLRPGGRWFAALVGLALVVAGLLVLGELDWAVEELGAESSYAWIPLVAGIVVLVAALLTPRRHQRMTGMPTVAPTT